MDKVLNDLIEMPLSNVVFLCGAGISIDSPTSLPTVYKFIESILLHCGMNPQKVDSILNQFSDRNYRFESLIDEIRKTCDKKLIIADIFKSSSFNEIHSFLAYMYKNGANIITTNFDNCIENAMISKHIEVNDNNRMVYDGNDLSENKTKLNNVLIKLHGSHCFFARETSELVITISALAKTSKAFGLLPNWKKYIKELLFNKTIVVMGYSCSDDFDITPLLYESKPNSIIWLNYRSKNEIPVRETNIDNLNISNLATVLPLKYYNGKIVPFLREWVKSPDSLEKGDDNNNYTVENYINEYHPTVQHKNILCNEILLSYGFYNDVTDLDEPVSKGQKIKALFRLAEYDEVINMCYDILSSNQEEKLEKELHYYLSSALYYKQNYIEAIQESKKCCLIAFKKRDKVFFLHSLSNYASINFMYATTLNDTAEEKRIIDKSKRIYTFIIKHSRGVSIEAEANALWGLGDIEKYYHNISLAKSYLASAQDILEKIGNVYALKQLENIILTLEDDDS